MKNLVASYFPGDKNWTLRAISLNKFLNNHEEIDEIYALYTVEWWRQPISLKNNPKIDILTLFAFPDGTILAPIIMPTAAWNQKHGENF